MNKPKCSEYLYVQFLLASQNNFTCTELSKISPVKDMAHDAPTRMLTREKLTPKILWKNAKAHVNLKQGCLIIDDCVIDKPSSKKNNLVHWQYSGAHHRVVKGIGFETLLWTNNTEHIPVDYRLYSKSTDNKSKNEHFRDMLNLAEYRGFKPEYVLMDSWYASFENLKAIRRLNWQWITQFRKNRVVAIAPKQYCSINELEIPPEGRQVHLKDYGLIKIFKSVSKNRGVEYYATSNLTLTASDVKRIYSKRWQIEEYHRGLKQQCGVAKCQARKERSQRNHVWCSIHTFLLLELHRLKTNITWQQAKLSIARDAIQQYLLNPRFAMQMATA